MFFLVIFSLIHVVSGSCILLPTEIVYTKYSSSCKQPSTKLTCPVYYPYLDQELVQFVYIEDIRIETNKCETTKLCCKKNSVNPTLEFNRQITKKNHLFENSTKNVKLYDRLYPPKKIEKIENQDSIVVLYFILVCIIILYYIFS